MFTGLVDPSSAGPVDIALDLSGEVRGRVLCDATGAGIPGARVRVGLGDGHILPGYAPGGRSYSPGSQPLVPGHALVEEIRLSRGGTVRGRVTVAGEGPAAGARIRLFSLAWPDDPKTETGRGGTFLIEGLSDVEYMLVAGRESDYESTGNVKVPAGAAGVELPVRRLCRFSGRLVDAEGRPVRASLGWRQAYPGGGWHASGTRVENDGAFVIRGLRPGPVRLTADLGSREVDLGEFTAPAENLTLTVR